MGLSPFEGDPSPDGHQFRGCASIFSIMGGLAVAGGLLAGLALLNTPFTGDVGPGPGFFGAFFLLGAAVLGLLLTGFWVAYFHPYISQRWAAAALVGLLVAVAVASWAPWVAPRTYFAPETIGVVSSTEARPDGIVSVKLEDGAALDVLQSAWRVSEPSPSPLDQPLGYSGDLQAGNLLLAGSKPSPWYAIADLYGAGQLLRDQVPCYFLTTDWTEREDVIELQFGIRLMKAPDFLPDSFTSVSVHGSLCLDVQGRVRYVLKGY